VKIEGAFLYGSSKADSTEDGSSQPVNPQKRKYVFFSSSTSVTVSPVETNTMFLNRHVRRRPSLPTLQVPTSRTYPFRFNFPRGSRPGEEIPATFPSSAAAESWKFGNTTSGDVEVNYVVLASWEASDELEDRRVYVLTVLPQFIN
jgi:hypothetical protein